MSEMTIEIIGLTTDNMNNIPTLTISHAKVDIFFRVLNELGKQKVTSAEEIGNE
jgi:hypothetical protein